MGPLVGAQPRGWERRGLDMPKPLDPNYKIKLEHYVHGLLSQHQVNRRYDSNFVAHCVEYAEAYAKEPRGHGKKPLRFGTKAFDRAMTQFVREH